MYWLGQTAAYGNRIVCNTPPHSVFVLSGREQQLSRGCHLFLFKPEPRVLSDPDSGVFTANSSVNPVNFFFYSLRPLFFSPELQLQACQEDIFIPSLWNRIQPVKKSSSSSFVVVEKIDGAGGERAFMFYLTAVKDITKALEARCVSSNQLIRPSVSRKKKQLMIFFF